MVASAEPRLAISRRRRLLGGMPRIRLPDGSEKVYEGPVTARRVAEDIGPRLAQAAVGARVDGKLRDLATTRDRDCDLAGPAPR